MAQQVSRSFQSLFSSHCCSPHGPPPPSSYKMQLNQDSRSWRCPGDGAALLLLAMIQPWMDPARASIAEVKGKSISWLRPRACFGAEIHGLNVISTCQALNIWSKAYTGLQGTSEQTGQSTSWDKAMAFLRNHACSFQKGACLHRMFFLGNKPLFCIHTIESLHVSGTEHPTFCPPWSWH